MTTRWLALLGASLLSLCTVRNSQVADLPSQPLQEQDRTKPAPREVPPDGPLTPEQSLKAFQLEPGLRVELVAAEPLVVDPVAMAFDERGRMFVAENRDYPTGPKEGEPPGGRIAMLEDIDGDGVFTKRTEFATGLAYPNGVLPWDGGVIVTAAPDILFLKDTDGDGIADERRVLFTGFSTKGSTQLRVSHPTLGIDNWIYVTSGLTGGEVTCPAHPERFAVKLGRTDFRFRPDLSEYEPADGGAQFGMSFDDFGRRFICYNRVQVQHVVLPSRYLKRNPHLAFSDTVQNCPAELEPEPLRGHGQAARVFPISQNVTTADSHAGTFTAACGLLIWRGTSLPDEYRGGAFSCEPTGNLIHFDRLEPHGATFIARRVRDNIETLASTDNWFRPVFLAGGPDGALYVCDMYRKTIEHPDYLPVEIRKHTDFDSGKGMGRIYRIVGDRFTRSELNRSRSDALREPQLWSFDGWQRDTLQRIVLAQTGIPPKLQRGPLPNPGLAQALQLFATHGMRDDLIAGFMRHPDAGVRENMLQLAEPRLKDSPELVSAVLKLFDDSDARVRFQWALTVGELGDARPITALAGLAVRDADDRWLRAAVLSSIHGRESEFLHSLLQSPATVSYGVIDLHTEFGRLLGASQHPRACAELIRDILRTQTGASRRTLNSEFDRGAAILNGLADAMKNRGAAHDAGSVFAAAIVSDDDATMLPAAKQLAMLFARAQEIAIDIEQPTSRRAVAIRLLGHGDFHDRGKLLLDLVDSRQPADVQSRAVRALAGMRDESIAKTLLDAERFPSYSPALREEVLSAMLSAPHHLPGLLDAIEAEVVPVGAIDGIRRKQLTEHKDSGVRERSQRIFAAAREGDRGKVYDEYKSVLTLAPNAENGRAVFKKHCANCHRLDRDGVAVGPDLFGIRNQPKEAILLHILIPELEITPGYAAYVLETKDGRVLTGLISSDTATSVTLRQALGKEETVLRADIEQLAASKLSLMPTGFEKQATRQELADLLSYLKGEKN